MALTRVAPAGIGSTPGTGYVIGDSFLHSRGLNSIDANYTGIVTTQSLRVIGDLEVEGTTTTLDTALTEVDKLEVGANNNTVGVAITQSGTGDILNLYDGSTQVVTVVDGGKVGIGTNNPSDTLDVYKGSSTAYDSTDDDAQRNDGASITIRNDNGTTNSFSQLVFDTGGTNQSIARIVAIRSGTSSNHLAFVTEDSNTKAERLRIDSSGRLLHKRLSYSPEWGAGLISHKPESVTTTYFRPSGQYTASLGRVDNTDTTQFIAIDSNYYKSSAVSAGIFLSSFHADAGGSACGHTIKNLKSDAGGLTFNSVHTAASVNNPAVETERLRIKTNGNIGIGTTNPAQKLHIWGNSATTALSIGDNSLTEPYVLLEADATDNVSTLHSRGNHPLTFEIQQSEKVRIQNDGKVGIGTVSPTDFLSIYGAPVSVWNSSTNNRVWQAGTTNGHGLMKVFRSDAEVFFRVDSSARKVGISTDSPSHTLSSYGSGNSGGVRIENTHDTTTVSGNTASGTFPHNLLLSNYESQNVGSANRMASLGFDVPTPGGSHANATIAFQATNSSGNGDLQFWLEQNNTPLERLRITSQGRVGIGTNSPTRMLHVASGGTDSLILVTGTTPQIRLNSNAADSNDNDRAIFGLATANGQFFSTAVAGDAVLRTADSGNLLFGEGLTERVRITSDGKMLLGTNTSQGHASANLLEIGNYTLTNAGITINNPTNGAGLILFGDSSSTNRRGRIEYSHYYDAFRFYTADAERLRISASGYVGIGSDNPTGRLDIQDNFENRFAIRFVNTQGNGRTYGFRSHGTNGEAFTLYHGSIRLQQWDDYQAGGNTVFYSNGTESFRIHNNGRVGIGTDNPNTTLHIHNNTAASYDAIWMSGKVKRRNVIKVNNSDNLIVGVDEDNEGSDSSFRLQIDGSEKIRVDSSGNVGVGTDNPTHKLYVNGTTRLGGGIDYGSTTILNVAPGVVKWDTSGVSGGRLNADNNGNWYLNNKSYPVYDSLGVNMNDIYGAHTGANNIGGWVYLGSTQHSSPYPRKLYKITAPNSTQGTFVYQVWYNGDANYDWGGLYEIRINNWNESSRFTSVAVTCINGDSDGLRVYAYNDSNGIWITTNAIWGSLYIRKFGYDDYQRSRGTSLCAVDNGAALASADVNGTTGTVPSGYTEVHASDSGGGGYDIENNHRFGTGGN